MRSHRIVHQFGYTRLRVLQKLECLGTLLAIVDGASGRVVLGLDRQCHRLWTQRAFLVLRDQFAEVLIRLAEVAADEVDVSTPEQRLLAGGTIDVIQVDVFERLEEAPS